MSATGLEVFDKTVHTTNAWLKEIMEATGLDRRRAYRALAAVLHALRDRLTVDEVAQLGAQLPILVRGLYYINGITLPENPIGCATRRNFSRPLQPVWMTSDRSIRRMRRALSSLCSSTTSPPARSKT
jgi:uncharacterized protein (DUF2267 family)